jgi:S-disulfanyl-L-cysteine oxidoreductase SoxD
MRIFETAITTLLAAALVSAGYALAAGPEFGRAATPEEIAAIDISIPPSGEGLPPGGSNAVAGAIVYAEKCAACHAADGTGKPADKLVGGIGSLDSGKAVKTVGSYWPYATTLFDYVRRSMPINMPMTLTDDEVYAVTAYVLFINGIVTIDQTIDAESLPKVRMPNRDGFVDMSGVR